MRMQRLRRSLTIGSSGLALIALMGLGGCAWLGDAVGSGKHPPDEFVVVNKRPLVVPPDFKLRPPEPGKPSPQNIQPAREVVSALFPGVTEVPPKPSKGELALLDQIASDGDSNVRSNVTEGTEVVEKGPMLAEILELPPRRLESDGATIEHVRSEPAGQP